MLDRDSRAIATTWGVGNNRSVRTASASGFLNCPGVRCGTGWVVSVAGMGCRCSRAAGRSRRAGIARPTMRPWPALVARLMKRATGRRAQKARNSRSGSASHRWRSSRRPASTAAVSRSSTRQAQASSSTSAAMRSMTARTRARPAVTTARSGQPAGDGVPAVQFGVLPAVRMFRGWPARHPQLTKRRVQRIQVRTGYELVHREGDSPAAVARVRIEIPSARAKGSAHIRSRSACSSRHAARETRVRTRRSRRPASIRSSSVTRPACQPRSGNWTPKRC